MRTHNELAISTRFAYNVHTSRLGIMYDDYDLDYTFMQDRTYDLDEMYDAYVHASSTHTHLDDNMYTYDLDDEYERDSHDYATLAYQHYA